MNALSMVGLLIFGSQVLYAGPARISLGEDLLRSLNGKFPITVINQTRGVALVELDEARLHDVGHYAHEDFGRCSGYVRESIDQDNLDFLDRPERSSASSYQISQDAVVRPMLAQFDELAMVEAMAKLSSWPNRYYQTKHGVSSQQWLFQKWSELAQTSGLASVRLVKHSLWLQPSVILTIPGATRPDEIVVLGAHGDTKNLSGVGEDFLAPGADDDASGVAILMELARIWTSQSWRPDRTIELMVYAAEEVGLRGSSEIAANYKTAGKKVVGVLQLDMTDYKGGPYDMTLMDDYTSPAQNKFIEGLLSRYLPQVKWSYDHCGYGCSDHVSWNRRGYPASVPFEGRLIDKNPYIHTKDDTLAHANSSLGPMLNFAHLALAFGVELAESGQ